MEVIQEGKEYQLQTVQKKWVRVLFYHKQNDQFVDGLTTEELLEMLINRQAGFSKTTSHDDDNLNALTHLKQALMFLKNRTNRKLNFKKSKYKSV